MSAFWVSDDGWPYPDARNEEADPAGVDDDLLSLTATPQHLLDGLDDVEREVVTARFGLGGVHVRSMRELHRDLGLPRAELRHALGSGLDKIKRNLMA